MNITTNWKSYRGFQLKSGYGYTKKKLRKEVDDFYNDLDEKMITHYDLSIKKNTALSSNRLLLKLVIDRNKFYHYTRNLSNYINIRNFYPDCYNPNRIDLKYIDVMRRVRILAQSSLVGLLTTRLCSTDCRFVLPKNCANIIKYIEQKATTKYSIDDLHILKLQLNKKTIPNNPYNVNRDLNFLLVEFNKIYNDSDKETFFKTINDIVKSTTSSRYLTSRIEIINNWALTVFNITLSILRSYLDKIQNIAFEKPDRLIILQDMYKFAIKISWIYNSKYKYIFDYNRFNIVFIKKMLQFSSENGLEMAVYTFASLYPEMMTKSIRPFVSQKKDCLYFNSNLFISHTDGLFGSLKIKYRDLLPNGKNRCII
jgi:hypothetical protein